MVACIGSAAAAATAAVLWLSAAEAVVSRARGDAVLAAGLLAMLIACATLDAERPLPVRILAAVVGTVVGVALAVPFYTVVSTIVFLGAFAVGPAAAAVLALALLVSLVGLATAMHDGEGAPTRRRLLEVTLPLLAVVVLAPLLAGGAGWAVAAGLGGLRVPVYGPVVMIALSGGWAGLITPLVYRLIPGRPIEQAHRADAVS
jgi:hypothetical protein